MILKKMKDLGEERLGVPCKDAVITVPCYFTDAQRRATRNAAELAGLNVLRLLNSSTAAATAHGVVDDIGSDAEARVLVVGLGAGALDMAFVTIEQGIFEVVNVAGDCHLGGEDFDDRLVFHFVQEFWSQHQKGQQYYCLTLFGLSYVFFLCNRHIFGPSGSLASTRRMRARQMRTKLCHPSRHRSRIPSRRNRFLFIDHTR